MEANRESAIDALTKARAKKDAGDHASAVRLAEKSLRICKTEEAQAFLDFLVKFGPGSEAAKAIDRVLQAADHYAVLDVAPDADAPAVKRAYQQRALKIHPDKNHAAGAQQAFQRLNEAHNTLSDPAKRRERAVQLSQALNQEQLQRRREEQDHREQIARWTALQRSWTNKTSETERALHERDEENDRIELEALRRSHASAASRRAAVEARLESEVAATGELHQICDALRKQLAAQARPGVAGGTSLAAAGPSSDLAAAGASSQGGGRLGLPEEMLRPLAPEPVAAAGGQDPRRPIRLPLGKINEAAVVVGRSSREHANSFEINDPLVSRKHVRIDTKAWPVPEQGVRGEDVIAVATALGANPIGVRHHADDSVEKADRGETLNLFHGDVLALLAADNAHPARYEYSRLEQEGGDGDAGSLRGSHECPIEL
ncbi:hypothetical protein EMIHUDRAFT_455903 [Emiliania huxleyi CCMP1516]|uniref:J domain-containing protein n=2 Tax=Emiliania huxleyi TaxID=2903 RepID=A0A0D3KB21_EMIH1|nr:hypothetical protein EMIHUDRAFT_455903 [Emiliania huxleyi CCMP1516]EOD32956.1 hypothetical protein EMIHUDRAFT_455903 [Emiliania huxleyi CCMP1516]|eukprot:XP_005785385.1 hypothetical protein EMIHUDRAFT_455903 [Emiliania huxleyi CCMP1516]